MNAVQRTGWTVSLLGLLLCAQGAAAQTRLAIVVGPAISRLSGSEVEGEEDLDSRTGMHIGVTAEVGLLGSWLSVAPGAIYVEKGFTFAGETSSLKLSYLEAIAPVRLAVPVGTAFDVVAFAGPGFALGFGCVLSTKEDNVQSTFTCENQDFDFKSTDITAIFGAGVRVPVNARATILLNGALDTSLRTIDSSTVGADVRHHTWLINAGVSFPLVRNLR